MNNKQVTSQDSAPGFWTKVLLALEGMSESGAEQLETRISHLEAEVRRLSAIQKKTT